jgi:FAD dependent oxidoreductase TIGR03364
MERQADVAIVGAGIAGLAHAYMALQKGYKVVLFEREAFATGASVRNFGLIWPIGQLPGEGLELALRAREHWIKLAEQNVFWLNQNGSLHAVHHHDELGVLEEFAALYKHAPYQCSLLTPEEALKKSPALKGMGLKGALYSKTECTVYSRDAVRQLAQWLQASLGLIIRYGCLVKEIALPEVVTNRETWRVERAIVCSGADFETLYPDEFRESAIVKCRLQMMKAVTGGPLPLGPSLCGGLTLRHYAAFSKCPSLKQVIDRYDRLQPEFATHGIHVLVAQTHTGELILGDSHHYGQTLEPFDGERIHDLILGYLATFTELPGLTITQRWNGVYAKLKAGLYMTTEPAPGVTIVNGLGGAGMTLSFGVAEQVIHRL